MPIEENKAVVRRFFEELLSTDNLAAADEILSPGFRFYFAGSPDPMDLERYKQFLVARRAAFPDRRFVVEDMIAEGRRFRPGSPCVALTKENIKASPQAAQR